MRPVATQLASLPESAGSSTQGKKIVRAARDFESILLETLLHNLGK